MPTQADIDERDNILRIIRECTGQQDDATIVAYLNRRAVQSPPRRAKPVAVLAHMAACHARDPGRSDGRQSHRLVSIAAYPFLPIPLRPGRHWSGRFVAAERREILRLRF